ncbi:hypothetical protein EC843_1193 [Buttiauxella sp. JUb87]|jgi:hypothetical protein|nr:hypothetical protein EC843_1193 [Buttiauxella sp. JUb87]
MVKPFLQIMLLSLMAMYTALAVTFIYLIWGEW